MTRAEVAKALNKPIDCVYQIDDTTFYSVERLSDGSIVRGTHKICNKPKDDDDWDAGVTWLA